MLISVMCEFEDKSREVVDDRFRDLRDAVSAALDLADRHGKDPEAGRMAPRHFEVWVDDRVHLSVSVLSGGLAPRHPK